MTKYMDAAKEKETILNPYMAPGLIPQVRRALISDKQIEKDIPKKPLFRRSTVSKPQTPKDKLSKRRYEAYYRAKNRDKLRERQREYYQKNKDRIKLKKCLIVN